MDSKRDKTRSTSEAMSLHDQQHRWLVRRGRYLAVQIAHEHGQVTSRDVWAAMVRAGDVAADGGGSPHWLGAVFHGGKLAWTGEYRSYSDAARNVHERVIRVWCTSPGVVAEDPGPAPIPQVPQQKLPGVA